MAFVDHCKGLTECPRRELASVPPSGGGVFSPEKRLEEANLSSVSKNVLTFQIICMSLYFRIHR